MIVLLSSLAPSIKNVEYWRSNYSLSADYTEFNPRAISKDTAKYYTLGLTLDGNRAMFDATGDTIYMDRCLYYVNTIINDAQLSSSFSTSQYKDGYLTWLNLTNASPPSILNTEVILHQTYCFRYVCMIADSIITRGLTGSYLTQYNAILAFVERNIWQKWYSRGLKDVLYRNVIHISAHTAIIADFLRRRSSNPTIVAQATTVQANIDHVGISYYGNSHMRSQFVTHAADPRAVFWNMYWNNYTSKPAEPYGSDTSHGAAVLSYLIPILERGYGDWTIEDMVRFMWLFKLLYINGNSAYNWLAGASGTAIYSPMNINDGFNKLGRFFPEVQLMIENVTSARNSQYWGNGALNAKRLLGL
jgi:hypothetical protein